MLPLPSFKALRQALQVLGCAAWFFSAAVYAQLSTPAPGVGSSVLDLLGPPAVGGGGGGGGAQQCTAPAAGATCGGAGPASQGNTSGTSTGAGNPINLTNGNKYQMEVDLPALPGELGIELVRHYNSAHRHVVGQLGMGWRLSYETDLYVVGQTVQILQADGARLLFNIDPRNPSLCAGANPAQGWVQIVTNMRGAKSYVWHWTHGENAGRQLRFDEDGKLVRIVAASGAVLSIARGPKGELLRVTDPQGRSLSFNHGGPGRLREAGNAAGLAVFAGVQSIDTPVGRFTYTSGVAASGAAQAANLTAVSLPTHAVQRRYHYEDPRHPLALTGVSVLGAGSDGQTMDQRLSTFGYNERGQAISSVRGPPQSAEGRVQVRILQPALPGAHTRTTTPGQTLLTNSLGLQTLYTHQIIGGEHRLVQALGAGCAQCGPVNMRWGYDSLGRLVEQTLLSPVAVVHGQPQGNPQPMLSTRHTLDAQGRTQRIEQVVYVAGKAQPPRLIERHEYLDARWPDKPTLLARPSVVAGLEHTIALTYNDAGQVTELTQTGFSPLNAQGEVARSAAQATRMERTTRYTYTRINGRSLLTQVDGPLANGPTVSPADSDITHLEWDDKGRFMVAVHTPGGLSSRITHDPASGQVQRVVNDAGFATAFTYDARQLLVRMGSQGPGWAKPQVQSFQFDALGQPVEGFEEAGEGEGASAAKRPLWRQAFDVQGRVLWRASALGVLETRAYNPEGQPVHSTRQSSRMAQSQHTEYDELGRPMAWRDGAGRSHELRYGKDGLPQAWRDPLGRVVQRGAAQAAMQRPLQMTDDFGRQVLTLSPDSGTTLRQFDAADRLVAMTDAQGHTARYGYDPQGRILQQTITDAGTLAQTVTQWRYSPRHLQEVIHPTQRERFEVDARGLRTARIVTLNTPQGELVAVTRYEHDERGHLVATTLPDGSRLIYERNGQQQVVALKRRTIQTPWLRWLAQDQIVAQDFQRDLLGLSGYTSGNGIEARYLRSASGDLARVVYRHSQSTPRRAALQARHGGNNATQLMGRSTQETIERLLGIAPVHAQAAMPSTHIAPTPAPDLPGALSLPHDPQALIDHRYLWSAGGHLLHSQQRAGSTAEQTQRSHAYNARGQLVASVQASLGGAAQEQSVWRYAYATGQRLLLSQQGASEQSDLTSHTRRSMFQDASHRLSFGNQPTTYNANGQPERLGQREFVWDALGRLLEVREKSKWLARYQYDHRGLRIGRQVGQPNAQTVTTHNLYDESRQPLAQLNAQGRITRQYLWLADMPLAVIDTPQGQALALEAPGLIQIWADVRSAIHGWLGTDAGIAWLHTNHLGAPEAATNAQGQIVWRASYAPFGAATVVSADQKFTLHLRLPGQVWDEETGLHYNRQRYYDPEHGQYLTPDPLGTPDGPNPYAYVAFNPLTNIDPDGLVLFAFDGTDNSDVPLAGSSISNVVQFRDAYDIAANGPARYVTGVGTDHAGRDNYGDIISASYSGVGGLVPDKGGNYSGPDRIARMMLYMRDEADTFDDAGVMDIDIVGFSRGAAQARDFANRLVANAITQNGRTYYQYTNAQGTATCQWINFRFMGLWDTVLSTNRSGTAYNMAIPAQFSYVAQAVALNEYRSAPAGTDAFWTSPTNFRFWDDTRIHLAGDNHYGGFPLQSIGASSNSVGQVRIERGFIGAHADIGGGYGANENGLSTVALNWMVGQAQIAGVGMSTGGISIDMNNPVIHDQSNAIRFGDPRTAPAAFPIDGLLWGTNARALEDRQVLGGLGGGTQRTQTFGASEAGGNRSMTNADTHQFITYTDRRPANIGQDTRPTNEIPGLQGVPGNQQPSNATGTVDMQAYVSWLRSNGYVFAGAAQ